MATKSLALSKLRISPATNGSVCPRRGSFIYVSKSLLQASESEGEWRANPSVLRVERAAGPMCARSCLFLFRLPYTTIRRGPTAARRGAPRPIPGRIPRSACGPSNSTVTRTPRNLRTSMKVQPTTAGRTGARNKCATESSARDENIGRPDPRLSHRAEPNRKAFSLSSGFLSFLDFVPLPP